MEGKMEMVKERRLREAILVYKRSEFPQMKVMEDGKDYAKTPAAIFDIAVPIIGAEGREVFLMFFMNSANKIQAFSRAFTGTVDQAVIYPREVVKYCILSDTTRIVIAHNHPSGIPRPSEHDIAITKKLQDACGAVDIEILDHVVIGDGQYYSFREHGLI